MNDMAFDIKGKLHTVFETKQVSERFSKREFVVEMEDGKYPQTILFQATGDRCGVLDEFRIGDEVRVTFNVRGREWKNPQGEVKFFNSLDVWKLDRVGESKPVTQASARGGVHDAAPANPPGADDDIPFIACELALDVNPIARVLR